jgi:O-antigen/teichoic acid export membrane protein
VRLIMLVPVIVVSTLAIVVIHRSQAMLLAGLLLIVTTPFGGAGPLGLLFRLRVNNLVPMLVLTLRSVLWGGSVAVIYWRHGGMIPLAIAMSATNAICSVVQALFALRLVDHWPRPSRAQLGPLLREALPVGLSGVLVIAYARIDQLIVFESAGNKAAGLYSSVYNVVDQAHFIPLSILTTLAPIIAASWPGDRERMLRTARLTAEMIAIASLGALAFTSVAAVPIVRLLFGQSFVPAATALPVLFAAFVFIAFGYLNGNLLVVMGMQKRLLRISLIALVVNLAGNLVLVPIFGFLAAAWMTLATEVVVFSFSYSLIRRRLELPWPKPGRMGGTVLSAALLAGELTVLKVLGAPLGVLVATTCISYPALLFAFGSLSLDDVRLLIGRERLV